LIVSLSPFLPTPRLSRHIFRPGFSYTFTSSLHLFGSHVALFTFLLLYFLTRKAFCSFFVPLELFILSAISFFAFYLPILHLLHFPFPFFFFSTDDDPFPPGLWPRRA
jgi:hypothetical protein